MLCSYKAVKDGLVGFLFLPLIQNLVAVDGNVNNAGNLSTLYLSIVFLQRLQSLIKQGESLPLGPDSEALF